MRKANPYRPQSGPAVIGLAGRESERLLAKDLGGRLRPASGAMEGAKGDIVLPDILVEAKSTTGKQIALKHHWLGKIAHEARNEGRRAALTISFVTGDGRPVADGEWVLIPLQRFKEIEGL